jgi:crotonobetainyl-CoA:carnitine CoA-transferase CaiB-like acyl-CoA transferase
MAEFSDTPMPKAAASPSLGQHTEEILQKLGYSDEEVSRWQELGIVR